MTIGELYLSLKNSFKDISSSPEYDAKEIMCHFLGIDVSSIFLHKDNAVPDAKLNCILDAQKRRVNAEPIAYITEERGFYNCIFRISPATLIPRADTETLVDDAVNTLKSNVGSIFKCPGDNGHRPNLKILDMCCGSGCIGISTALELSRTFKHISLTLSDISEDAMIMCKENARNLINGKNIDVDFKIGNYFDTVNDKDYDAILANPPYVRTDVIPTLERQVQFEPTIALDGGPDGLDGIREIAKNALKHLDMGGLLEMEIGYDQGQAALDILKENGYCNVSLLKDLGGNDRVVKGFKGRI